MQQSSQFWTPQVDCGCHRLINNISPDPTLLLSRHFLLAPSQSLKNTMNIE